MASLSKAIQRVDRPACCSLINCSKVSSPSAWTSSSARGLQISVLSHTGKEHKGTTFEFYFYTIRDFWIYLFFNLFFNTSKDFFLLWQFIWIAFIGMHLLSLILWNSVYLSFLQLYCLAYTTSIHHTLPHFTNNYTHLFSFFYSTKGKLYKIKCLYLPYLGFSFYLLHSSRI